MKIGILTFPRKKKSLKKRKQSKNTRMLVQAAKSLGHTVKVIRADKCQTYFNGKRLRAYYNNRSFPKFDVIIPRVTSLRDTVLEGSLIRQLELLGYKVLNSYDSVIKAKNKLRTMQVLNANNIPVPKTIVVRRFEFLDDAIKRVGDVPVVLKMPHGSMGIGVAIVESKRSLISALDIFWRSYDHNYMLIQEYIKESSGKDVRAFVVGGEIIGAMERSAQEGEFRSNIYMGGEGRVVDLTKEEEAIVLAATKAMKLEVAGVDILRSKRGPLVIEVNCNPGLKGITEYTGVDVASAIIKYACEYAKKG